jgi:PAS domain S-box-containing protein
MEHERQITQEGEYGGMGRKSAEAKLKADELQMRKMLQNIPVATGVSKLGPDPELLFLNAQFVRPFGYTLEDIPTVSEWAIRAYPDEHYRTACFEWWNAALARAIPEQGQVEPKEFRVACKDGTVRDVLISATVCEDLLLTTFVDITQHKGAQETLRESEERFRLAFNNANTGMCLVDLQGKLLQVNAKMSAIFGYSQRELAGMSVNDLALPEDAEASLKFIRQAIQGSEESAEFEKHYRHRQGHIIHCLVSSSMVRDQQGRSRYFISQVQDITERKRTELALRESERRLLRAQQVAQLGNWEWDLVTKQIDWADETYRIHGIDPQKVRPSYEAFLQLIDPAEHEFVNNAVAEILAGKGPCEFEYTVIRPDNGQRRIIHSKAEVILDESGKAVKMVGTVQDITERKRLEERAWQAHQMEAMSHLTGGMAHEFNNILAAVMTGLELVRVPGTLGEDRELLEVMVTSCQRAAGLVKQLLAFSSQSMMQPQSLDLAATVAKELEELRALLGDGIELKFTSPPSLGRVKADGALMAQVLRDLCRNAREAMPSGGVLGVELGEEEVGAQREKTHLDARAGRFVRLTVSDTGRGMNERTMKRLFEPFFTTKKVVKGAGLSLATVRGIVRQHGGWVEVESVVGQGSAFRVYLPLEVRTADTAVATPQAKGGVVGSGTILLVEDEESLRTLTRKFLVREGYQVLEAADGAQALALWAEHEAEIDLIFTDMVMPGALSGLDVAQQAMAKKPGLKAIITSGYNTAEADLEKARTSGILYLSKPWLFKEAAEIMRGLLGGGQGAGEARRDVKSEA